MPIVLLTCVTLLPGLYTVTVGELFINKYHTYHLMIGTVLYQSIIACTISAQHYHRYLNKEYDNRANKEQCSKVVVLLLFLSKRPAP